MALLRQPAPDRSSAVGVDSIEEQFVIGVPI